MIDTGDWKSIVAGATDATQEEVDRLNIAITLPDSERRVTWMEDVADDEWWPLGFERRTLPCLQLVRCLETGAGDILRVPKGSAWEHDGFPRITWLELTEAPQPGHLRRVLWKLPRASVLDFRRALMNSSEQLELLSSLPPLRWLSLTAVGPPPRALEALRRSEAAAELWFLDLSGNWAVGEQVEDLGALRLRGLSLAGNRIALGDLKKLAGSPLAETLVHLDLRGTGLGGDAESVGELFSSLRTLKLDEPGRTSATGEKPLPPEKSLFEEMTAGWSGRIPPWIADPDRFWWDDQTYIDPRWASGKERPRAIAMSVDQLLGVSDVARLKDVEGWTMLADSSAKTTTQAFSRLPSLKELDLGECVTDNLSGLLSRLPSIEGLELRFRALTSRTVRGLLKSGVAKSLRRLDASRCFWSSGALSALKELELDELVLQDCVLDEAMLQSLRDSGLLRSLRRLDLRGNAVSAASSLRGAVPELLLDGED